MHVAELLLSLQDLDNAIAAAGNRRQRLPERATVAEADSEVKRLRAEGRRATEAFAAAEHAIAAMEAENSTRDTKKARLNAQLKTVIAPREAEALMHEIALLDEQRSAADDRELEQLDAQEQAMAAEQTADDALGDAEPRLAEARAALAAAESEIDAEVADLVAQRGAAAAAADPGIADRYESLRKSFAGVAISRLSGTRCGGCHLDQSSTAMEKLKHHPAEQEPLECEQCGRLLVR